MGLWGPTHHVHPLKHPECKAVSAGSSPGEPPRLRHTGGLLSSWATVWLPRLCFLVFSEVEPVLDTHSRGLCEVAARPELENPEPLLPGKGSSVRKVPGRIVISGSLRDLVRWALLLKDPLLHALR